MIGLGFLVVAVIYVSLAIVFAWLFARGFQSRRARATVSILTLLVFALIPTWDIIPGRIYFNHLCKTEQGVTIHRVVEGAQGLYGEDIAAGSALHFLETIGYSYVEGKELGVSYRFTLGDNGGFDKTKIHRPAAPYILVRERHQLPLHVIRYKERIADRQTQEVVATKTTFYWGGNWIQVRSAPLLGGGEYCKGKRTTTTDFLMNALRPR